MISVADVKCITYVKACVTYAVRCVTSLVLQAAATMLSSYPPDWWWVQEMLAQTQVLLIPCQFLLFLVIVFIPFIMHIFNLGPTRLTGGGSRRCLLRHRCSLALSFLSEVLLYQIFIVDPYFLLLWLFHTFSCLSLIFDIPGTAPC